ncbi:Cell wall / vacuolar inhibitor of fructosidase 1, partial [Mucuna pruriens]
MTKLKPLVLCLCLEAVVVMISIPGSHCRALVPNDEKLIENTCKKTPNYSVCLQSLKASPGSSSADVTGLAQIMVKVMKAKANDALRRIHELQRVGSGPQERKALSSCADKYKAVLIADVPQATEALQKGDPKFAEDGANDAANEATYCESDFSGKSPLTKQNNAMHDVAAVTAAISLLGDMLCTLVVVAAISKTNCRIMEQKNSNLIEETCKQTRQHDLCVQYLLSDPRSTDADDVTGLALIMVNVIKTKANKGLDKIHQLLRESPEPGEEEALSGCVDRYKAIVEADVAQAVAGLQKGNPKFAEDGANDAGVEATSCEKGFSGKSPLTNDNNAIRDAAATTAAIVRLLL